MSKRINDSILLSLVVCILSSSLILILPICLKAGAAIDWTPLRRIERHSRFASALRAPDGDFNLLANAGRLREQNRREAFVLRLFAGLAAFRGILQTFIAEELLLADCPYKIFAAVNAANQLIFEFSFGIPLLAVNFYHLLNL
jgi:hypothetical protein